MKREPIILTVFALAFVTISLSSYTQKSATYDEPKHLTVGYAALAFREYRLDLETPPLLRMWAALPLLGTGNVKFDTNSIYWLKGNNTEFFRVFLYQQNDADRLLYRARFMIVLLGVALGLLLFVWARKLFGCGVATVVLALYCLDPNILAHASVVTTDLGFACLFCGTLYFLWRTTCALNAVNLLAVAVFFALAQVSKFSALALGPIAIVLLAIYGVRKRCVAKALFVLVCMLAAAYAAIWAVYGFCHAASLGDYFLPQAYVEGVRSQLAAPTHWSGLFYLAGKISERGWWYYYAVAFAVKTPVALLALFFGGLVVCAMQREKLYVDEIFLLVPLVMFFTAASLVKFNLGLRYVLPIYPLVLLVAGKLVTVVVHGRHRLVLVAVLALSGIELAWIHPHELAFFNFLVGGAQHGSEWLVDSNLDWGQDLKLLGRWMQTHRVSHINLAYFGTADPAYYQIEYTPLRGSYPPPFVPLARPRLPGYVAVSATTLRGVFLSELGRTFYKPLLQMKPVATIGYSIYIYRVERPWW
jgi:hypothetical protein